ncbi:UNVERIFIED_CONTAM: hypothetical protein PYX00_000438 [Menopon gallinae]|uniref:GON-4-like protein n=1 Tax=Menopon gallinae TaxID=328185 RepID=A0AAW2IAK1_9NEOP
MNRKTFKSGTTKTEDDFSEFDCGSKSEHGKARDSNVSDMDIMWPITPIKKTRRIDPLFLINEELPEESDDEDYRPGPEDLQDQSEEETGRQSVVSSISRTSTLDVSATQYLESFDSNLLVDESANQSADYLFKVPEENIGQRTRSKLCLSDTPLEIIEKAFVPPDITTDMYDFKCDNEDWENFLKEFAQPLSNNMNNPDDDDDEADPDYNVMAEEEEVDKEELRRDRAVKISRKELRKLMAELFESPDEYSSDEEEEKRVCTEITNRVNSDMRKKAAEKAIVKEEEPEETRETIVTPSQKLLIEQQLRQHVQLTTQHFLQTCQHPMYGKYAGECKVILATLLELGNASEKSIFNIFNLKPAFSLIEVWEKYLLTEEGKDVIRFMEREVAASEKARKNRNFYRIGFHPSLMKTVCESKVFLYPLLLPSQGFRCDGPFQVEFISPEDSLIAIALEEFTQYMSKNSQLFDKKKSTLKTAVELLCEHLLVTKKPSQVYRHIRNVKNVDSNPLNYYYDNKKAPKTVHYVIPFNEYLKKAPKDHASAFLPEIFREHLKDKRVGNKENDNG